MSADSVLGVLLSALESDPANSEVRIHVVGLLAEAGQAAEGLVVAVAGLELRPADRDLLRVAADAADGCGRSAEASGYRTLLSALGGAEEAEGTAEVAGPEDVGAAAGDDDLMLSVSESGAIPDSADDLLDQWARTVPMDEPEIGAISVPSTKLADVGGMDAVKERLELSFLGPMRDPQMQEAFGKSLRGGLMLWGPPGCGKTFMARAVAGELGARFYEVGLADVLDMWLGASERNLRSIFDVARNNRPCALFFDEIDALGIKRSQLRTSGAAMRGVVNQLLNELDGVSSDNEGVFVLAATNHPWDVDPALLRPGRLDRRILVLPPDEAARAAIIRYHLRGRPADEVDTEKLAAITTGLTGADIALVCEGATEEALAASMKTGTIKPITTKALLRAAKQTRPSISGWLDTARNHATYNNQDGSYDELLRYLRRRR